LIVTPIKLTSTLLTKSVADWFYRCSA